LTHRCLTGMNLQFVLSEFRFEHFVHWRLFQISILVNWIWKTSSHLISSLSKDENGHSSLTHPHPHPEVRFSKSTFIYWKCTTIEKSFSYHKYLLNEFDSFRIKSVSWSFKPCRNSVWNYFSENYPFTLTVRQYFES